MGESSGQKYLQFCDVTSLCLNLSFSNADRTTVMSREPRKSSGSHRTRSIPRVVLRKNSRLASLEALL